MVAVCRRTGERGGTQEVPETERDRGIYQGGGDIRRKKTDKETKGNERKEENRMTREK